jgi:hypothetical protein
MLMCLRIACRKGESRRLLCIVGGGPRACDFCEGGLAYSTRDFRGFRCHAARTLLASESLQTTEDSRESLKIGETQANAPTREYNITTTQRDYSDHMAYALQLHQAETISLSLTLAEARVALFLSVPTDPSKLLPIQDDPSHSWKFTSHCTSLSGPLLFLEQVLAHCAKLQSPT